MSKLTDSKRSKLYAGFAGVAALALFTACADDTTPEEEPAEPGVQEDPAQDPNQEDPAQDPMEEDPMQDDPADDGADVEGAGESNATSTLGLTGSSVSWSL